MSARSEKGDGEQAPMSPQSGAAPKPSLRPPPPLPPSRAVTSRPPLAPGGARTNPPPPVAPGHHGTSAAPPQRGQTSELRLHVSVRTSVRDPNLLIVRPLAEGQRPPPGTREAFLELVDTESPPNAPNGGRPL